MLSKQKGSEIYYLHQGRSALKMKVILSVLFVLVLVISKTKACGDCYTIHPQQHYCNAKFAMRLRILSFSRESDIPKTNVVIAEIINSWKKGPDSGEFQFYSLTSFCGTQFVENEIYVVTGTKEISDDGRKYWLHGACDFAETWDNLTPNQKVGFRREYAAMCAECEVPAVKSASNLKADDLENNFYQEAMTYWTPTRCYYNPHKTQQFIKGENGIVDCEDKYGVCAPQADGECGWRLTDEYEECFDYRDKYVLVESGDFAITDESQCAILPNRRKRQKCRKRARQYQMETMSYEGLSLII